MHAHFCLKQRGHNMCKRRFLVSEKWLHGVLLFCCWLFEAGLCGHQLRGLPGDGRPGVEACGPPSHFQLFFLNPLTEQFLNHLFSMPVTDACKVALHL
jgi:hypothetical protein